MNLLLDTHALLWWLDDHPRLSRRARAAIGDGQNVVFISAAVIWEIRIKQALGKLSVPEEFRMILEAQPFLTLDITANHAHAVEKLPPHHRDPFDRMLIAQATVERLTLVSNDTRFKPYGVPLIKA